MREKVCYLHIGTMKTGTTTIQDFLWINRELLAERYGILYPKSIKNFEYLNDHNPITDYFFDENNSFISQPLKDFRKEIVEYDRCIISSENIQWKFCDELILKKFRNFLLDCGFTQIRVIVYLRNPADLFVSMCSQDLKDGEKHQTFTKNIQDNPKMMRLCDYRRTLMEYESVFSKENIIVRLFDIKEFKNGNLIEDFLWCLKIPYENTFVLPQPQNATLDLLGMRVLEKLNCNSQLPRNLVIPIAEKYFSSKSKKLKFFPPKQVYKEYEEFFRDSTQWVLENYFPNRNELFQSKNLNNVVENYELKEATIEMLDIGLSFLCEVFLKLQEKQNDSGGGGSGRIIQL